MSGLYVMFGVGMMLFALVAIAVNRAAKRADARRAFIPIWTDALAAAVARHPEFDGLSQSIEARGDDLVAHCTVHRRGKPVVVKTFALSEAKRAGIARNAPWTQYPGRMCGQKAKKLALTSQFPDVLQELARTTPGIMLGKPSPLHRWANINLSLAIGCACGLIVLVIS